MVCSIKGIDPVTEMAAESPSRFIERVTGSGEAASKLAAKVDEEGFPDVSELRKLTNSDWVHTLEVLAVALCPGGVAEEELAALSAPSGIESKLKAPADGQPMTTAVFLRALSLLYYGARSDVPFRELHKSVADYM